MEKGERMLCLQIEDDGRGYPEDVLRNFREDKEVANHSGERVGLRSIRRMLALMYEREDLFEISNVSPYGCRNTFRIPLHPVQEVKVPEADETIG